MYWTQSRARVTQALERIRQAFAVTHVIRESRTYSTPEPDVGRGGIVAVHEITGIARSTIGRGLDELDGPELPDGRVRREGGGRREVADIDPTLLADLQRLVEPVTMGDPERPLKWVSKARSSSPMSCANRGMR